jgi:hypothetical protein
MSMYSQYVDGLVKLIEEGRPGPLKEVIYARLRGDRQPVYGLVSPPLSRDEPDENAVFYFVYEKLTARKNEKALTLLRRLVMEMLMEAFANREDLLIIDALGQMAGFFQVKEYGDLAEQLRQQLWGFMSTGLQRPLLQMMQLQEEELAYARRALDLWLTVTPPLPGDRQAHYYQLIIELFEQGFDDFGTRASESHFHLLLLMFRAVVKTNPYNAACSGFLKMCARIEVLDRQHPGNVYCHGWLAFCRELGVLFKYDETSDRQWRSEFKKGILKIDEDLLRMPDRSLFWKSLGLMDGLDREIKEALRKQRLRVEKYPWPDSGKVISLGAVNQ